MSAENSPYPDSSFLVSLLLSDGHSRRAGTLMQHIGRPLCVTPLHHHEVRNAIHQAVFRGEIDAPTRRGAFRQFEEDIADGFFTPTPVSWNQAFKEAASLGERFVEKLGTRGADVLHVAIAISLGKKTLVTFDKRQGGLAENAGLRWLH